MSVTRHLDAFFFFFWSDLFPAGFLLKSPAVTMTIFLGLKYLRVAFRTLSVVDESKNYSSSASKASVSVAERVPASVPGNRPSSVRLTRNDCRNPVWAAASSAGVTPDLSNLSISSRIALTTLGVFWGLEIAPMVRLPRWSTLVARKKEAML